MQQLEQFYDDYVEKVYKFFYIKSLDRYTAEDLTSHTFVSFIEKTNEHEIKDMKKYLYAIMRNVWMDHLRIKYKEAVDSLESIENFEQHTTDAIAIFESQNMKERAAVFISRLPDKQEQIARMRLLEEITIREIAKKLGKSVPYVKTTQNRAIKSLKLMLDKPELGGELS